MATILERIVARKREELAQRRRVRSEADLRGEAAPLPRDFAAALRQPGLSAICEIKRRSPSKGVLREPLDPARIADSYARGGAAALSILTDHDFFGGSEADLISARAAVELPVLRKDFTLDPYHVWEARAIGASAVLLIVRILSDGQMRELLAVAREAKLAALVEVHDERELDRGVEAGAQILGVNNRNLDDFTVSLETSLRLRTRMPADVVTVSESGIRTSEDAGRLSAAGFNAILVGESLITTPDPAETLKRLLQN